jgi:hypothetical protein
MERLTPFGSYVICLRNRLNPPHSKKLLILWIDPNFFVNDVVTKAEPSGLIWEMNTNLIHWVATKVIEKKK